ncbi:uromodulin-like [Xenopus tropicalis]|uniref:Uromodulin-like n=1 Tax=Xenopus tropicalis TaxID=8364 RepID=A0A8J1J2Z3_XENTR|nr:uromodulin-like [Xenopus tropicalis]
MTVTMTIYKDPSFTDIITSDTVLVSEQTVYVSVVISQLDIISLKVLRLYVSPNSDHTVGPTYNLLENGCPNLTLSKNNLNPIQNGLGTEARFKMNLMIFYAFSSYYLFADVTICNSSCIPVWI